MGEMADMIIDQIFDPEYEYYGDDEDWYDASAKVKCKACGQDNLRWVEAKKGWRLFDKMNQMHVCKEYFEEKDNMGHYDACYEADDKREQDARKRSLAEFCDVALELIEDFQKELIRVRYTNSTECVIVEQKLTELSLIIRGMKS